MQNIYLMFNVVKNEKLNKIIQIKIVYWKAATNGGTFWLVAQIFWYMEHKNVLINFFEKKHDYWRILALDNIFFLFANVAMVCVLGPQQAVAATDQMAVVCRTILLVWNVLTERPSVIINHELVCNNTAFCVTQCAVVDDLLLNVASVELASPPSQSRHCLACPEVSIHQGSRSPCLRRCPGTWCSVLQGLPCSGKGRPPTSYRCGQRCPMESWEKTMAMISELFLRMLRSCLKKNFNFLNE